MKQNDQRVVFGSKVRDKGRKYAGYFNSKRPVINEQAMVDLHSYMVYGGGASAFERAVTKFKISLAQKAVVGLRRNAAGNVFPQ
jgi:hypothetical protein